MVALAKSKCGIHLLAPQISVAVETNYGLITSQRRTRDEFDDMDQPKAIPVSIAVIKL